MVLAESKEKWHRLSVAGHVFGRRFAAGRPRADFCVSTGGHCCLFAEINESDVMSNEFHDQKHDQEIIQQRWKPSTGCAVVGFVLALLPTAAPADDEIEDYFEKEVRPILVEHCIDCHGAKTQSGGLRVDSREALVRGGDSGSAVKPGDAAASLLMQAVRRTGDLEMPPEEKLTAREISVLERWIGLGAVWPASARIHSEGANNAGKEHWAFQPVREVAIPGVADSRWVRNPIDAFVLARLRAADLQPADEADRRVLIRRLSYTLTGLPPSPEDIDRFLRDTDAKAYERLVDRLLDSPHYGEHWARHWLDVARYSDTKGYVYAREERFWPHAWAYRDWVVQALNNDLPYDRFLLLQLAADQVEDCDRGDLAAMGFLTLGRRFLGVQREIIDDRIDVVCRGTMGLTVSCARCHDHKYDPIPTADYYSLYGVFDSSAERLVPLVDPSPANQAFFEELEKRRQTLQHKLAEYRQESAARVRQRVGDYLHAQTELEKYPADGFDQIFQKSDLLPAFVRRWERYLMDAELAGDPVFAAWHAFRQLPADAFAAAAAELTHQLRKLPTDRMNPLVADAFTEPPASFQDVIDRYAQIFRQVDSQWKKLLAEAEKAQKPRPEELADPAAEQLRQVLYGPGAPCEVPNQPIVHSETYFDSGSCTELWKLQGEVDRWIIQSQAAIPFALTLIDRPQPIEPHIFRRGNPLTKGRRVERKFLSVLSGAESQPFQRGSGRLELAQAIIDPANPLTARVIVNRVWTHHFGQGLVTTPSDFGTRAAPPSHPDLLDWLAKTFVAEGWSLKKLHRWILTSASYRQASTAPLDPAIRQRALTVDPANRLLWRMNAHRLTFEEFRDSLLAATGDLDPALGGKPSQIFNPPFPRRRTVYGLVDRQFLPGTLRVFDFANPDLHIPQRNETTVPQQALFLLNHPSVLDRVRALAKRTEKRSDPRVRVTDMFQAALGRQPTENELHESLQLVAATGTVTAPATTATADDWQYGYGALDEAAERLAGFTPLPHFTGTAWQGGPNWPDAKLGWVQLTATGGHPGNDRAHAAVRRWTASQPMTVEIRTQLNHEAAPGDGIRAFIVSSRVGILQRTEIHQQQVELNLESLTVQAGETIDFVVDIGKVLNSDQYLWEATVQAAAEGGETRWNSKADFPKDTISHLGPWEQLAQVLLCSNEFLFID